MELVEGETLRARLAHGRLEMAEVRAIAAQIARGVARAHEKGVVHRDLKPDNVMITAAGAVKVLDFGLAKLGGATRSSASQLGSADTETRQGEVVGTPLYMSPEQATGKDVDARTDVFSFGVILYEMLTGVRPFAGNGPELVVAICRDDPEPPSKLRAEVSADLERVVLRCLAKKPEDRYASGAAVLEAMDAIGAQEASTRSTIGVVAGTTTATVPAKRRAVGWLVVLLVVLAAVGGVAVSRVAGRGGPGTTASPVGSSAPPSASSAPARGIAITDHPAPRTANAEAAAAYAAGMQLLRDASIAYASDRISRAADLDPSLAAAHLRLALFWGMRDHVAAASQFRAALDERDAVLLHVAEVQNAEPPAPQETIARLRAAADRYPRDAEIAYLLGQALFATDEDADATAAFRRALELDPEFAMPLWALSSQVIDTGGPEQALPLLARCLEISPGAASCLRNRAGVNGVLGRCAEMEADARQMTRIEPTGYRAYEYLGIALAARGAPAESVRAALDKMVAFGEGIPGRPDFVTKWREEVWLAELAGDFPRAEAAALEHERMMASRPDEQAHEFAAMTLIELYEEEGQRAKALDVAEAYARKAPAWIPRGPWNTRAYLVYARRHAGRTSDAAFREARAALLRETHAGETSARSDEIFSFIIYAGFAETPDEVADAAAWAAEHREALDTHRDKVVDVRRARIHLLTGQIDDALKLLRRATADCYAIGDVQAIRSKTLAGMQAHVLLGQALEAKGDTEGACGAYRVVLDRWKDAKPRSLTLEQAKARSVALRCPR